MVARAVCFSNVTLAGFVSKKFESKIRAMIIRIAARTRSVEIDDPRNFKAFSMRIEGHFRSIRAHIDRAP